MNCKYCAKYCKNLNSLTQHQIRCKQNPEKIFVPVPVGNRTKGRIPWNKGQSKQTNSILAKAAEKARMNGCTNPYGGHASTAEKELERRRKISSTMKTNGISGGIRPMAGCGHKGWYKGFYCDSTYELAYVIYNLDHNIEFKRCPRTIFYLYEYKGSIHKYYPDFMLADGSLVEIKGYRSDLVDLKTQAVKDRSIKVLFESDLTYAFEYIKLKYNVSRLEDLYE